MSKQPLLSILFGIFLAAAPLLRFATDVETQLVLHVLVMGVFLFALGSSDVIPYRSRLLWAVGVFFLAAALSAFGAQEKASVRDALIVLLDGVLAAFTVSLFSKQLREKLLLVPVSTGLFFAVISLFLAFARPFHYNVPDLFFVNANVIAGYLTLCFPLSLAVYHTRGSRYAPLAALIFLGILATYARTAIAVSCVSAVVFAAGFRRELWRRFALAGIIVLLYLVTVTLVKLDQHSLSQTGILANRIAWWQAAAAMFTGNPVNGAGWGNFGNLYQAYRAAPGLSTLYAHNIPLQLLAETGVEGLLAFFLLAAAVIFGFFRAVRGAPPSGAEGSSQYAEPLRFAERIHLPAEPGAFCGRGNGNIVAGTALLGCIAFLADNLFNYSFYIPASQYLFFVCLGLAVPIPNVTNETATRIKLLWRPWLAGTVLLAASVYPARYLAGNIALHRGIALLEGKNIERAGEMLELASAYDPLRSITFSKRAEVRFYNYTLGKQKKELASALQLQEEALRRFPGSASYWSDYAWLLKTAGHTEKALSAMQRAARYDRFNTAYRRSLMAMHAESTRGGR